MKGLSTLFGLAHTLVDSLFHNFGAKGDAFDEYVRDTAEANRQSSCIVDPDEFFVWRDQQWRVSGDGFLETKAFVLRIPDGYIPGYWVSRLGGEPTPLVSAARDTLAMAIAYAKQCELGHHQALLA